MPWSRPRWMSSAPRSSTPVKQSGRLGSSKHSGLPETGIWNSTLRSVSSIISSLLYSDSLPMALSIGPSWTWGSRSGLNSARFSEMVSVRSAPPFSMPTPCAVNRASCAALYRDASVSISNSPWIWLCARYPTVANSLLKVALTFGL